MIKTKFCQIFVGPYKRTYIAALRQDKLYLPRQAAAAVGCLTRPGGLRGRRGPPRLTRHPGVDVPV